MHYVYISWAEAVLDIREGETASRSRPADHNLRRSTIRCPGRNANLSRVGHFWQIRLMSGSRGDMAALWGHCISKIWEFRSYKVRLMKGYGAL